MTDRTERAAEVIRYAAALGVHSSKAEELGRVCAAEMADAGCFGPTPEQQAVIDVVTWIDQFGSFVPDHEIADVISAAARQYITTVTEQQIAEALDRLEHCDEHGEPDGPYWELTFRHTAAKQGEPMSAETTINPTEFGQRVIAIRNDMRKLQETMSQRTADIRVLYEQNEQDLQKQDALRAELDSLLWERS